MLHIADRETRRTEKRMQQFVLSDHGTVCNRENLMERKGKGRMEIQEALQSLKFIKGAYENLAENGSGMGRMIGKGIECPVRIKTYGELYQHHAAVIQMALEALEEVQQYREIGTVRELKELKESSLTGLELTKIAAAVQKLKKYEEIGTVEECREAREKQIPKKVIAHQGTNRADCPVCGATVRGIKEPFGDWCSKCGQKLKFREPPEIKVTGFRGMEERKKAFIIPHESWYKDTVSEEPCIHIGLYYEDRSTDVGVFKIVWNSIGIQLRAYDDSWEALGQMPELIGLMGRIQIGESEPTVQQFAELLKGIGFKDLTERERENI